MKMIEVTIKKSRKVELLKEYWGKETEVVTARGKELIKFNLKLDQEDQKIIVPSVLFYELKDDLYSLVEQTKKMSRNYELWMLNLEDIFTLEEKEIELNNYEKEYNEFKKDVEKLFEELSLYLDVETNDREILECITIETSKLNSKKAIELLRKIGRVIY